MLRLSLLKWIVYWGPVDGWLYVIQWIARVKCKPWLNRSTGMFGWLSLNQQKHLSRCRRQIGDPSQPFFKIFPIHPLFILSCILSRTWMTKYHSLLGHNKYRERTADLLIIPQNWRPTNSHQSLSSQYLNEFFVTRHPRIFFSFF